MKLKIKQMNGNDFEVELDNENLSVTHLLEKIAAKLDIAVDRQRLIYSGRVLSDTSTFADSGITDGSVVHLVVRPVSRPPTSSAPAPSMTNTSVSVNTGIGTGVGPSPVPGMQFQNLGNGVTVGSLTIDPSAATGQQGASIGNLINQMVSSIIPPAVQSQGATPGSTTGGVSGVSPPVSQANTQATTQDSPSTQEHQILAENNIFLAQSHLLSLQQAQSTHTPLSAPGPSPPHSSMGSALDTLASTMHATILPIMQLGQSLQHPTLQQNQHPHMPPQYSPHQYYGTHAPLHAQQAEVFRVQSLLRHISEATDHLATALQHTQLLPPPQQQPSPYPYSMFPHLPGGVFPPHVSIQQQQQQQPQQQQPTQRSPHASTPTATTTTPNENTPQSRPATSGPPSTSSGASSSGGEVNTDGPRRVVMRFNRSPAFSRSVTSISRPSSETRDDDSAMSGVALSPQEIQQHIDEHREAVAAQRQRYSANTSTPGASTGADTSTGASKSTDTDTSTTTTSSMSTSTPATSSTESPSQHEASENQNSSPSSSSNVAPPSSSQSDTSDPTPSASVSTSAAPSTRQSHSRFRSTPSSSQPSPAASIRASVTAENNQNSAGATMNPIQGAINSMLSGGMFPSGAQSSSAGAPGSFTQTFVNGIPVSQSGTGGVPANFVPGDIFRHIFSGNVSAPNAGSNNSNGSNGSNGGNGGNGGNNSSGSSNSNSATLNQSAAQTANRANGDTDSNSNGNGAGNNADQDVVDHCLEDFEFD